MGRRKELIYYNNCLKGAYLTDKDCQILDELRDLDAENGCVVDLKNIIYNISSRDVELIKETKNSEFVEKTLGELRDNQTIGVAYMYFAKRMVLGDSVGMGKTVEIAGLFNLLEQKKAKMGTTFRFLFLTEKNLLPQAQDELIKFTGDYVDLLYGEKKHVNKFVEENQDELNYSVVGAHSLINSVEFQEYIRTYRAYYGVNPFDALVIDESSIIGNTATKTYDNAVKLAEDFDWVIVMNATAFESNLRTFYAQLNFCDETLLPVKTVFSKLYEQMEYYGAYPKFNGKYKNANIFKDQVKYRYLARTRKSSGATMKDCSADVIVVEKSSVQKELLKKTSMPNMVIDCPSYFDEDIVMNRQNCPKIGALLDLVNGKLKNEDSILIYSRYIESQKGIYFALTEAGINCEIMNGETDVDTRNNLISGFKQGQFRVLITNVQKGLNFGNCNTCIFYSYDPNPNRMVQFEGRMTRSFNIIGKHVYLIISKGKELSRFKEVVSDRAKASDLFAGSDFSCVMSILLDSDKLKELK